MISRSQLGLFSEESAIEQAKFAGAHNRLGATLEGKFAKEMVDVGSDRAGSDDQPRRDLRVGETRRDQVQDFQFTGAERLNQILARPSGTRLRARFWILNFGLLD